MPSIVFVGIACSTLVIEATNKLFVVFAFSFSCPSLMTPSPNLMDLKFKNKIWQNHFLVKKWLTMVEMSITWLFIRCKMDDWEGSRLSNIKVTMARHENGGNALGLIRAQIYYSPSTILSI